MFGSAIESDLNSVDNSDKVKATRERQRIIGKWIPEAEVPLEKRFADPAAARKS